MATQQENAEVQVANIALSNIGAQSQISSFDEGTPEANAISLLYVPKFLSTLRSVHWDFARYQATLSLLKAAGGTPENLDNNPPFPPQPWLYEYAYPADCAKARFIVPLIANSQTGETPIMTSMPNMTSLWIPQVAVPFVVGVDTDQDGNKVRVILTNQTQAQLVYTQIVEDPNLWDPLFYDAFSSVLSAWLVNALAQNAAVLNQQVQLAKDLIAQARVANGNEGPETVDHIPDWLMVRGAGARWAPFGVFLPYEVLALPGGSFI